MDRLKQKGAHFRAATSRVINELNTLMDATPILAGELNDKLGLLKIKEGPPAALDEEIERLVEDGDLEEELTSVTCYQESIALTKLRAERLLSSTAHATSTAQATPSSAPHVVGAMAHGRAQLPKLELTKFQGDIAEWPAFWDQFESTIHNNDSLADVDKLSTCAATLKEKPKMSSADYELQTKATEPQLTS